MGQKLLKMCARQYLKQFMSQTRDYLAERVGLLDGERERGRSGLSRSAMLDPQLKVRGGVYALLRVRVLGARVREQGVAARVYRRTERTGVLPGEMHVIVIADVRHDLTAQRAPPPLVAVTLSLKYLWYPPIFQLCNTTTETTVSAKHRISREHGRPAARDALPRLAAWHRSISGSVLFARILFLFFFLSFSFHLIPQKFPPYSKPKLTFKLWLRKIGIVIIPLKYLFDRFPGVCARVRIRMRDNLGESECDGKWPRAIWDEIKLRVCEGREIKGHWNNLRCPVNRNDEISENSWGI